MAKLTATEIDAITIEIVNRLQNENDKILTQMKEEFESSSDYQRLNTLVYEFNETVDKLDSLQPEIQNIINFKLSYLSYPGVKKISLEHIVKEHIKGNTYYSPSGLKLHAMKQSKIINKVVFANLSTNGKVDIEELIAEIVVNL